jgi:hypothetical protein
MYSPFVPDFIVERSYNPGGTSSDYQWEDVVLTEQHEKVPSQVLRESFETRNVSQECPL